MPGELAVEHPAVPISPVHHGRNGEQFTARRWWCSAIHGVMFSGKAVAAQLKTREILRHTGLYNASSTLQTLVFALTFDYLSIPTLNLCKATH
jgi:hypothetical protein